METRGRRVCLAVPPESGQRRYLQLPLDALIVAAALRAHGIEVAVWDQRHAGAPPGGPFDIAVVASATIDRAQCYPLRLDAVAVAVARCHERFPGATVVVYGPHGVHLAADTMRVTGADVVAPGLEPAAVSAALAVLGGRASEAAARPSAELARRTVGVRPAIDLVDVHRYYAEVVSDGEVTIDTAGLALWARGCPYACEFCHVPFAGPLEPPPTGTLLEHLDGLGRAGVHDVFFLDLLFGIPRKDAAALCAELRDRATRFVVQTRPEVVLRSDVEFWRDAGCTAAWLGAESIYIRSAGVRKPVDAATTKAAVAKLRDAGVVPLLFVLIGLPEEPPDATEQLEDWLGGLECRFTANVVTLRPGTALFNRLAPALNDGALPRTWREVRAVNARYLHDKPHVDAALERLGAMPWQLHPRPVTAAAPSAA